MWTGSATPGGNCYSWALIKRVTYWRTARIRWRCSDHGPWPHAAVTFDGGETYWCLVPKRFTQRQWMRKHRRPPFFFRGRVVRDFKPAEGVNA